MSEASPTAAVSAWLESFGAALEGGDVAAAAELFEADGYWRDLVSFTWNISTLEGRDAIRAMLEAHAGRRAADGLGRSRARRPRPAASPRRGSRFETAVARGRGHLRLRERQGWTLLTTMTELKGFEERTGRARDQGRRARRDPRAARPGSSGARTRRRSWATTRSPTASSSAAGRAASRSARGCGGSACRRSSSRRTSGPATPGASATSRSACTTRSGTTTCRTCRFPDDWPVFSPKDKIGDWLEMYTKVMELNYWGSTECTKRALRRGDAGSGRSTVERERRDGRAAAQAAGAGDWACRAMPNVPKIPGAETLRGRPAPLQPAPRAARPTAARSASCSAPTTRRTTSAPPCGSTAPTSR